MSEEKTSNAANDEEKRRIFCKQREISLKFISSAIEHVKMKDNFFFKKKLIFFFELELRDGGDARLGAQLVARALPRHARGGRRLSREFCAAPRGIAAFCV